MQTTVVDHPLAAQLLARVRDERTGTAAFRDAIDGLAGMLVYEATRSLETEPVTVQTPLAATEGARLRHEPLVAIVLRAGLGMQGAAQRLLPDSPTVFIGLARNEETFAPEPYLTAVPTDLGGRPVLVLDPMLATGGSLALACQILVDRGAGDLTAVCVLAAPEGIEHVAAAGHVGALFTAAIDDHLDEQAYIVPGLGDAGDRLFGEF